ncbi:right-handed parallel beta-helix repeat-containing protein [Halobaculum marinum]|uniref:Right-handed parallel beta-helix repeat-containing protein n=1 Tax=Halobaculum marinum TaxID=3031996 RepID=A0ABD5WTB2_9EURY|nr:right-handed parallel beta-helix repeat-containing protein [Halobaculum sp. DT55]
MTVFEQDFLSRQEIGSTEFNMRADRVNDPVERTVTATLENQGDGEAEIWVRLNCASNPFSPPLTTWRTEEVSIPVVAQGDGSTPTPTPTPEPDTPTPTPTPTPEPATPTPTPTPEPDTPTPTPTPTPEPDTPTPTPTPEPATPTPTPTPEPATPTPTPTPEPATPTPTPASTDVDSCTTITESGTYDLTSDIDASDDGPCIHIRASDVTLEGNGNTISGPGGEDSLGLLVYNGPADGFGDGERLTNVTVRDVEIADWGEGVRAGPEAGSPGPQVELDGVTLSNAGGIGLYGADDSVLRDVTVTDSKNGLYLWETSNVVGEGITLADNAGVGLFLAQVVEDSRFSDVTISGNEGGGIAFSTDAAGNTVTDATVENNDEYGVRFSDSRDNLFEQSTVAGSSSPAVIADNAAGDQVEAVTIRSGEAAAVEIRSDSDLGLADVSIDSQISVRTPDGGSPASFDATRDNPVRISTTAVDELGGDQPGEALVERGVTVSNADSNVVATFEPSDPGPDASVQLFRFVGGSWSPIDGATGSSPTATLSGSESVAPFGVRAVEPDDEETPEAPTPDDADDEQPPETPTPDDADDEQPPETPTPDDADDEQPPETPTPDDADDEQPPETPTPDDESSDTQATTERTLEIISTAENEFEYEFVFEGTAEKSETDTMAADSSDDVESRDDGTVVISGSTGDNSGDAFAVTGEFVSGTITGGESNYEILLGGDDITDQVTAVDDSDDDEDTDVDDVEMSVLRILSTEDNQFEYEIVVAGTAVKSETDTEAADSSDDVETRGDGTVVIFGSTGDNSGDAYEITGTVEEARVIGVSDGFEILVDGEPIDVETAAESDSDDADDSDDAEERIDATIGGVGASPV